MATRMLIDARHPEETRVAVLKGNRIEEFDFESAEHKQIKGNIYLAKVTRVEPSLQAAFVDFGGNRHGFLAFSEIHPDYYQIPKEDRDAPARRRGRAEEEAAPARRRGRRRHLSRRRIRRRRRQRRGAREDFAENGVEEVDTSDKDDVATIEGRPSSRIDDEDDDSGGRR
jgi:ribonuclease E